MKIPVDVWMKDEQEVGGLETQDAQEREERADENRKGRGVSVRLGAG